MSATYKEKLEQFLESSIGLSQIKHPDGRTLNLNRKEALQELEKIKRQEEGTGRIAFRRFDLKSDG
jgi:hypothetical protein